MRFCANYLGFGIYRHHTVNYEKYKYQFIFYFNLYRCHLHAMNTVNIHQHTDGRKEPETD